MNTRSLGWTVALAGGAAALLGWWLLNSRATGSPPPGIDLHHVASEPARPVLDTNLKAVTSRSIAGVEPGRDGNEGASTSSGWIWPSLKVLVVNATTHAPLPGMNVRYNSGQVVQNPYDNFLGAIGPVQVTDAAGRVELANVDFSDTIEIRAWDPAGRAGSAVREVPPLAEHPIDEIILELSPGNDVAFWMRVVDQETNEPIAGAWNTETERGLPPEFSIPGQDNYGLPLAKASDANGLLLYSGPVWARHYLRLSIPEHATVYVEPDDGHVRADNPLLITSGRVATLRLRVVSGAGIPLANAAVRLSVSSSSLWRPDPNLGQNVLPTPSWSANTDDSGGVTFTHLPPDVPMNGLLDRFPPWRAPEPIVLHPGEVRDEVWTIDAGCTIHGLVIDQTGAAVSGCDIWLQKPNSAHPVYFDADAYGSPERTVTTDTAGRFTIPQVGRGAWWIGPGTVKHADGTTGGDTAPFAQILQIVAGQADSDLVIHVDRGLFVSGRVLAPAGAQLGEGFVVLDDHARALAVFEPWNADGTFVIGPLLSGTVTLTANSHSGHAQSEGVVAEAGQKNVVLQLRSGGSISGRVLDEEGRPVESSIVLSGHGAGADGMQTSVVESNKEFEFAGLDPGLFGLVAWTVDGRAAVLDDIDVAAGSAVKGVELHVVPAGHVRIRYVGPDRNGFVEVTRGSIQVASGGFARDVPTVLVAPPGMVRIRLLTSETHHILERTVEVKVGETSEVTIDEGAH